MENGFGQTIIQVDNEPAILQLAQEAANELTIPWRHSSSHSHQGPGARHSLQSQDNVPEVIFPYALQHVCLIDQLSATLGVQYNNAICNFDEIVLADVKAITVNNIKNNEQKVETIWLGHTTNSGEHIVVTKENNGKVFCTRRLTGMTPEKQWNKDIFDNIDIPHWTRRWTTQWMPTTLRETTLARPSLNNSSRRRG
eukprot:6491273-Amphidinium_carterae.2